MALLNEYGERIDTTRKNGIFSSVFIQTTNFWYFFSLNNFKSKIEQPLKTSHCNVSHRMLHEKECYALYVHHIFISFQHQKKLFSSIKV